MAFIQEFLHHYIKSHMEDPAARGRWWHDHTRAISQNAAKKKESWQQPTKPYGFWSTEAMNSKYEFNKEPGHMHLPGRGSPHGGETQDRVVPPRTAT